MSEPPSPDTVPPGPADAAANVPAPLDAEPSWEVTPSAIAPDDPLLACLMILTKIFHRPLSASALSAGLPIDDSGMSPELFLRAAERTGFSARLLRKPLRTVSSLSLPAVLLLRDRRACVLTKIEAPDGAIVVVPESGDGERRITLNKLEAQYEGLALITQQEYRFDNRAEDIAPLRRRSWFWGTLASLWRVYLQVALAAILINLFALASPLFIMNVYDRVVPNNAISTLWVLAVGAATVFGFDFLLRTIRGYFIDVAGKSADTQLSAAIFQQVLGMRLASRPTSAGAFANTLREFDPLRDFFTSATLATLIDLPFALFFIAVVWGVAGPLAIVPAAAVPIVVGMGILLQFPLSAVVKRTFREAAQKHALLVEALGGLETIKSISAEGPVQKQWERFVGMTAISSMKSRFLSSIATNTSAFMQNSVTVCVVIYGVHLISAGELTVGALVAATILSGRAMAPLAQVASLLTRLQQSRISLQALDQIMQLPVERPPTKSFLSRHEFMARSNFATSSSTTRTRKWPRSTASASGFSRARKWESSGAWDRAKAPSSR